MKTISPMSVREDLCFSGNDLHTSRFESLTSLPLSLPHTHPILTKPMVKDTSQTNTQNKAKT